MVADSHKRGILRQSLGVPGSQDVSPVVDKHADSTNKNNNNNNNNGNELNGPVVSEKPLPSHPAANGTSEHVIPASNPNSEGSDATFSRSTAAAPGRFPPRKGAAGSATLARQSLNRESVGEMQIRASEDSERPVGVQLSDRPMDD